MANYLPPEIIAVLDCVDTYLRWDNVNQPPRGHQRIHPSAFGKCLRKMQYERYEELGILEGGEDEKDPSVLRIFGNGHSMHDRWRQYFENLGVLKGYWTCTNPFCAAWQDNGEPALKDDGSRLDINDLMENSEFFLKQRRRYGREELQGCFKPQQCKCGWQKFKYDEVDVKSDELNIYGHADLILDFSQLDHSKIEGVKNDCRLAHLPTGVVVADMKSINHFGYQEVSKGEPHSEYCVQLMIYANILQCDFGILIYENKNTQKTCAFRIDKNEDTLWPQIQEQAKTMSDMAAVVDENGIHLNLLPPPRPLSLDSKDCEYCRFKGNCELSSIWDDPNLNQIRKDFYGDLL
jgi:hypothetical protein